MYNRYIPDGTSYRRIVVEDTPPPSKTRPDFLGAPESPEKPDGKKVRHPIPSPLVPHEVLPENPVPTRQASNADGLPAYAQKTEDSGTKPPQNTGNLGGLLQRLASGASSFDGGAIKGGLNSILKSLKLDDLDTGDILIMLILLFLFLEGDDIELVITLGLMLLLGI